MEIVRFGPGHRRAGGPAGSLGLADQVLWSDDRAHVSELAFTRQAIMPPTTSPHDGLFIVVSGGGWVQVGDERLAVHHGEAVTWPAGVSHGAWTDGSEMRVLIVELSGDGSILAVPAVSEDGNATGIGGDQTNDAFQQAGAVYLY